MASTNATTEANTSARNFSVATFEDLKGTEGNESEQARAGMRLDLNNEHANGVFFVMTTLSALFGLPRQSTLGGFFFNGLKISAIWVLASRAASTATVNPKPPESRQEGTNGCASKCVYIKEKYTGVGRI